MKKIKLFKESAMARGSLKNIANNITFNINIILELNKKIISSSLIGINSHGQCSLVNNTIEKMVGATKGQVLNQYFHRKQGL